MSKRKRITNADTIRKRKKEGRGQGEGINYKPYLNIQDVASNGRRHRVKGIKTGRIHQYMSDMELNYHYVLEAAPTVVDIREQWPLDQETTLQIADQMNIKHPTDTKTKHPIVMTTDFFITIKYGAGKKYIARTVKPSSGLSKRVCEKFEIERLYFQSSNIDWGIVTEKEIPMGIANNMKLLMPYLPLEEYSITLEQVAAIDKALMPHIIEAKKPLRKLTTWCDEQLGLSAGQSLTAVYHLIISGHWQVDISQKISATNVLHLSQNLSDKETKQ